MSDSSPTLRQHLRIGWRKHKKAAVAASLAGAAGVGFGKSLKDRKTDQNWERGKARAKNALITGTAGAFAGSLLDSGRSGHRGARLGGAIGAIAGMLNDPKKRSKTADTIATGGDWTFSQGGRRKAEGGRRKVHEFADPQEQNRKHRPVLGTVGALTLPGVPGAVMSAGLMGGLMTGSSRTSAGDDAVIDTLKKKAAEKGVGVHPVPMGQGGPVFYWNEDKLPQFAKQQMRDLHGTGHAKGIGIADQVRGSFKPGMLAHEVGHAHQSKLLNSPYGHMAGKLGSSVGGLYASLTGDEKKAKAASIAAALAASPMLASEVDASVRGSRYLKNAGVKGWRRMVPAMGIPTYAAVAAAPYLAYRTKKALGGYRLQEPSKPTQMSSRTRLHSFEQQPKRDNLQKARDLALTGAGATVVGGGVLLAKHLPGMADNLRQATTVARMGGGLVERAQDNLAKAGAEYKAGFKQAQTPLAKMKIGGIEQTVDRPIPRWKKTLVKVIGKPGRAAMKAVGLSDPSFLIPHSSSLIAFESDRRTPEKRWKDRVDLAKAGVGLGGAVALTMGGRRLYQKAGQAIEKMEPWAREQWQQHVVPAIGDVRKTAAAWRHTAKSVNKNVAIIGERAKHPFSKVKPAKAKGTVTGGRQIEAPRQGEAATAPVVEAAAEPVKKRGRLASLFLGHDARPLLNFSSFLNPPTAFNSITWHDTEADLERRKAARHREKKDGYGSVAGIAALPASAMLHEDWRERASKVVGDHARRQQVKATTDNLLNPSRASAWKAKVAKVVGDHPGKAAVGGALLPAALLGGASLYHGMRARGHGKKADKQAALANDLRKQRNAARSSQPFNFSTFQPVTTFARGDYLDEHGRHVSAADVLYGRKQAYNTVFNPKTGRHEVDLNSPKDAALLDAAGALHSKAKTMARWGGRGTGFVRDATDALTGKPRRKDASGRTQKREWEKPWFSRHAKELLTTAALVGGGVALKRSPRAQALWGKAKAKGEEYAGKAGEMLDRALGKAMAPKNPAGLKVVAPAAAPLPKSQAFVLSPPKGRRTIKEVDQAVKKKTGRNANRPLKTGQYYASPPPIDPYPQHAYPEMTRRMSAIQGCLVQLDEFIPSKDAVESLREMRRYNRWIKPEKIGTPEQQERQSRMMLPTSRIQQAAAAGWLPWGAKARARRQANRDIDWVNEGLMSDYNRGFSIPCAFRLPPSALTAFDDAADMAGWDVRDPRGRSARVFAPGAGKRDRREKYWHEKVDNERKLWAAASLLAGGTGVAAARKLLPRTVEKTTEKVVPVVLPKAESFTLWGSKALSRAPRAARKKGLSLVRSREPVQKGLRLDGKEYIAASDRRPVMQFSRLPVSLSPRLHLFAKAEGGRRKAEGSESPTLTPLKKGIAIGTGATAALTGAGLLAGTRRGRDLVRAGLNWVDRKALKSEAEAAGQATMNARASVRNGMKTETTSVRRRPQRRGVFGTIHEEPMEKSPSLRKAVKGVFRRAKRRLVDKVNRIGTEEMSAHEGTKSQRLTQFASRSEVLKEVVGNLGRTASRFVQDVSGGSVKSAQKELAKRKGHLADFRNLVDRIESGEAAPRRWSRMPGMPDTLEKARINRMRRASGQVLQATQRQDRARNLLKISGAAAGSGAVAGYAVGRSRHQGTEASRQQVQKRRLA